MKVAVVGAGVIGLSTAWWLARDGHEVTVIDRNDGVALETSYANGAQLSYSYVAPLAGPGVLPKIPPWLLRRDSPLRFYPALDPDQWRWLVRFEEIADRTAAEAFSGRRLSAEALPPRADEGGLYVHELVGALVVGVDGTEYGRCVSVLANPAHDILELDGGGLVPVVFVQGVDGDGDARRVIIDPPEGLFDL